jgi:hypothetical protein
MKKIETHWQVWSYDVWGNKKEGYEVNDRFKDHEDYMILCQVQKYNEGTEREFEAAYPSDSQIRKALCIKPRVKIETEGDDINIYVSSSTGYPLGELNCISHESLSPIRAKENRSCII